MFVTEHPKYREVHAAAYRDRVVHHLLHALLEPAFESQMSAASFACRAGKGTHAAVAALQSAMWRLSRHGGVRVVALQMDVANFFMSLHRPTLLGLLEPVARKLEAELDPVPVMGPWELCRRIVLHDPSRGGRRTGDLGLFARVPPHKRFGALGPDRGLPIGNLTSQFFANVYLTPLDYFVQRTLGFGGDARYVDDFILLDPTRRGSRPRASASSSSCGNASCSRSRAGAIVPASRGIDFLGYVVRPRYVLPRRRVVDAFRDKLALLEAELAPLEVGPGVRVRVPGLGAVRGPVRVSRLDEGRPNVSGRCGRVTKATSATRRRGTSASDSGASIRLVPGGSSVAAARPAGASRSRGPALRSAPARAARARHHASGLAGARCAGRAGRLLCRAAARRRALRPAPLARAASRLGAALAFRGPAHRTHPRRGPPRRRRPGTEWTERQRQAPRARLSLRADCRLESGGVMSHRTLRSIRSSSRASSGGPRPRRRLAALPAGLRRPGQRAPGPLQHRERHGDRHRHEARVEQAVDPGTYTFSAAQTYCAGLSLAGGGWRVPSVKELMTLFDFQRRVPGADHRHDRVPEHAGGGLFPVPRHLLGLASRPTRWGTSTSNGGDTNLYGVSIATRVRCVR